MFDQILDLVGQPPGSLVYHFVILFAVEAAFAISLGQWMRERTPGTFRLAVMTFAVVLARLALLVAALAAWQGYIPRNTLLPPVERLADTLTLLTLAWGFVTMDDPALLRRNFIPDVVAVVLVGLAFIGFAGTTYYWRSAAGSGQLFNGLWLDVAWSGAQVLIAAGGLLWMLARARYVYDLFLKAMMLILPGAAAALHIVQPVLGDVDASMRVAQIVVMPMLAALAYRHVVEQLLHWDTFEPSRLTEQAADAQLAESTPPTALSEDTLPGMQPLVSALHLSDTAAPPDAADTPDEDASEPEDAPETVSDANGERAGDAAGTGQQPAVPADEDSAPLPLTPASVLEVVDAVGRLLSTLEPGRLVSEAPRAVATALRADVCALAIVDENVQRAAILGGYDNISQMPLQAGMLDLSDHPTIVNALGRLRQMRLTTVRNMRELRDIYAKLKISHEGPAYLQPLVNGEERIGVLLAGSPYSKRMLATQERDLLDRLGPLVTASLLNAESYKELEERAQALSEQEDVRSAHLSDELTAKTAELSAAQRQIDEMKTYIRDLHRQVDVYPEQQQAAQAQIEHLIDELERVRGEAEQVEALQAELEDLRSALEAREAALAAATPPADALREMEEARHSAQSEIAALRARLAQAAISQQEVTFLQEQLAAKSREAVLLQARLSEAQAVAEALRGAPGSAGGDFGGLQARLAAQAREIEALRAELQQAHSGAGLSAQAQRAAAEMDAFDREAMATLEARLVERGALIAALETQLSEKARALVELRSHMDEVTTLLRNVQERLDSKNDEVTRLEESLTHTRQAAQARINELEAVLGQGEGDRVAVDQARVEMLEAELAEKSALIRRLEAQLGEAQKSMGALETQLSATHDAVGAAIAEAQQVDHHDEVIASLAQELRTPMSSITGYTDLLLRESVGILGPLQRKFLQRVRANTERMGTLLNDLIRITAIDTGRLELAPERVDVFYALEEVLGGMAVQFSEKGLTLRLAVPDELPSIVADRGALLEMVHHLLMNAVLASPVQGEVRLEVETVGVQPPPPGEDESSTTCLLLSVQDTGSGIHPDDYERVFSRKYRADNPLIDGVGDTGVGLALARALIEAHGGRIWVSSSQDNGGTTFHALLPLEPIPEEGPA